MLFSSDKEADLRPTKAHSEPPPAGVKIQIRNLHKSFGDKHVLRGISLTVEEGKSAVVLGGSGTGKSVLIRHIVGLLLPDSGEVWVEDKRIDQLSGDALDKARLKIGYLFQGGALFDSMSVEENMLFFLDRHTRLSRGEKQDRIVSALESVNLPDKLAQFPAELSGGQKKRIALARAMLLEPEIILYDEPTTGLDPVSVRMVSEQIAKLRDEQGITSISITHDLLCAEIIADHAHFIHEGRFLKSGSLDDLRHGEEEALQEFFYGTDAYIPSRDG